jgi:hypothetical protein
MMVTKIKPTQKKQSVLQKNSRSLVDMLYEYCKDIEDWPARWEIVEADLTIGQAATEQFKRFLIDRIEKGRAKSTIKIYAYYLWALGGELIRQINEDDSERRLLAKALILKYIDDSGGPYWRHARDELEHARFDAVCKQLFKFISANAN